MMATLPPGFVFQPLVTGLTQPTSVSVAPDGRLFITEKPGTIRIATSAGVLQTVPALTLEVNQVGERGVQSIEFDPEFATNGQVYIYATRRLLDRTVNRLSQYTMSSVYPNTIDLDSEIVLVDDIPISSSGIHNGGFLKFGGDGMLYLGIGDANTPTTAQDLSVLPGKILRIDPKAFPNIAPIDNPFVDTPGARPEIWAYGFRNPFTGAVDPVSGAIFVNDVGGENFEEVNELVRGGNFGWPGVEGPPPNTNTVAPVFSYSHNGSDASVVGGTFYRGSSFPASYQSRYFAADFSQELIRVIDTNSFTSTTFATAITSPNDLDVDADGNLLVLSFFQGTLYRIKYQPDNLPPEAIFSVDVSNGYGPLTVAFDATASFDPESLPLTYLWEFGDGTTATTVTASHTYNTNGAYLARLTVSDGVNTITSADKRIVVGSLVPTPVISTPTIGTTYQGGVTISFAGSATDPDEGTLADANLTWNVYLHHESHRHPFLSNLTGVASGSFTIPTIGEFDPDQWFRIELTATDATGIETKTHVDVTPELASFTLSSNVVGANILLDGSPRVSGTTIQGVVGMTRTIEAPTQQIVNGQLYHFLNWSDGVTTNDRLWNTDATGGTFTANYEAVPWAGTITGEPAAFFESSKWREYRLTVRNNGSETWFATGPSAVRVAVYFTGLSDEVGDWTAAPNFFAIPNDLLPGDSAEVILAAEGPAASGSATLRHRLVAGDTNWFGDVVKTTPAVGTLSVSYAVDMSTFPSNWPAGATLPITVTITNTGTAAWNASGNEPVHMGVAFVPVGTPAGARPSEPFRVFLPRSVAPGDSVTVTFAIDAPTATGNRVFRLGMVKEGVNWFAEENDTNVMVVADRVTYDVSNVPTTWVAGETKTYSVTVTNTGNTTWQATGTNRVNFAYYFEGRSDIIGDWAQEPIRVFLPANVAPGDSVTLNVIGVPPATGGNYVLRHRLVTEGVAWFPQLAKTNVVVQTRAASYDISNVPTTWIAGQSQTYTVTLTNTGTTTWTVGGANPVRLGTYFEGRSDTIYDWDVEPTRVFLPQDVAPGDSITLTVTTTPPATGGAYVLRFRMVAEGAQWFAALAKTNVNVLFRAAQYDISNVPTVWRAGETKTYSVTVTNSGTAPWNGTGVNPVHLAWYWQGRSDTIYDWDVEPTRVLPGQSIAPGDSYTYTVTATAPTTGGDYILRHRIVVEGVQWLPELAKTNATVNTYTATYNLASVPASWLTGETKTYAVQVTNTGNTIWRQSGPDAVALGWYFDGTSDAIGAWSSPPATVALPGDVAPGATVTINVTATAPPSGGSLVLRHRMVSNGVSPAQWFAGLGKTTVAVETLNATYGVLGLNGVAMPSTTMTFQVDVTNTGTTTWRATGTNQTRLAVYFSGRSDAIGDWTSAPVRFSLSADVAPGQTSRVSVSIATPATLGAHALRQRMVVEGRQWAKSLAKHMVAASNLDANIASSAPRNMTPGQTANFNVTITNTSNVTWLAAGTNRMRLAVYDSGRSDAVGDWTTAPRMFALPNDVAPGGTVVVPVSWTASATVGTYPLRHRMAMNLVGWSNSIRTTPLAVGTLAAAYAFATTPPATATGGQTVQYSLRVTNTGTTPWEVGGIAPFQLGVYIQPSTAADAFPSFAGVTPLRFTLPQRVLPGATITIPLQLTMPSVAGTYTIRHRMFSHNVAWFAQLATATIRVT